MSDRPIAYPFTPLSASRLRVGQFWAVPLSDQRFACGRVLQTNGSELPSKHTNFFDRIEPPLLLSAHHWRNAALLRGSEFIRAAESSDEAKYKPLSTWGYNMIRVLAEMHFVSSSP